MKVISQTASNLAKDTVEPIQHIEVPEALAETVENYKADLMGLASSLLAGGHSEDKVRAMLDTVFASYREELLKTILALRENA